MGETYLVTGGAGFIGSRVVDELHGRRTSARVMDNFSAGHRENLSETIGSLRLVGGRFRGCERAHDPVAGVDYVIHATAMPSVPRSVRNPLSTNAVDITGGPNVLLAARGAGARRVVTASSSSV
jgi:UDP-N-acetylglucosamine 4-epimerase